MGTTVLIGVGAAAVVLLSLSSAVRHGVSVLLQWAMLAAAVAVLVDLLGAEEGPPAAPALVLAVVVAVLVYRRVVFPVRMRLGRRVVPATIVRISDRAVVGDAAMMRPGTPHGPVVVGRQVHVLFDSRGRRISVRVPARQARAFSHRFAEGDTGRLTYSCGRLVRFEPPTAQHPVRPPVPVKVFVSYPHEWEQDAAYVARFFSEQGLQVWFDRQDLRVGDRLSDRVRAGVAGCDVFVPILAPAYFASPWCVEELTEAAAYGRRVVPIKVTDGDVAVPAGLRHLYHEVLGEPIYLDLRGRNPLPRLRELAERLAGVGTAGR